MVLRAGDLESRYHDPCLLLLQNSLPEGPCRKSAIEQLLFCQGGKEPGPSIAVDDVETSIHLAEAKMRYDLVQKAKAARLQG